MGKAKEWDFKGFYDCPYNHIVVCELLTPCFRCEHFKATLTDGQLEEIAIKELRHVKIPR